MPKGIPNKKKEVEKVIEPKAEPIKEVVKETPKPIAKKCSHHPSCQCQDPLSQGQAYFEDGPTGAIVIGDAVQQKIFWHAGNDGKGAWILKKR